MHTCTKQPHRLSTPVRNKWPRWLLHRFLFSHVTYESLLCLLCWLYTLWSTARQSVDTTIFQHQIKNFIKKKMKCSQSSELVHFSPLTFYNLTQVCMFPILLSTHLIPMGLTGIICLKIKRIFQLVIILLILMTSIFNSVVIL